MERNIKNPSLVPEWFIYSGSKVMGVSGADGRQYYFVGSSEKGQDGKTPDIRINAEKGYIWESRYYPDDWNEIPGSPAASGLVGPEGPQGISGDSVKVKSIVNENGGTWVTLAWGENFVETSSFFVPSGLSGANGKDGTDGTDGKDGISPTVTTATIEGTPGGIQVTISGADGKHQFDIMNGQDGTGASYSFDGTTLSGNGSTTDIGVNTTASMNFINSSAKSATYADQYFDIIEGKYNSISEEFNNKLDKPDITQPELNEKYLVYSTLSGQGQPKGWTNILEKVYSKSEADGTFIKKNLDNTLSGDGSSENNKLGLNTANINPNKQYAWTTEGWKEVAAQSNLSAGTDLKIVDSIVQVNTNGIANSAGSAFVEGINTIASGIASHAEGRANSAYSDYSHIEGYRNSDYKAGTKLEANHTEGAYNQTSGVYAHVEGHANKLYGYGVHMQGGYNEFTIHNTSADRTDPNGRWNIWGISIEGMANATTAEPISGYNGTTPLYTHGGILKVIGNGTRTKEAEDPSSETITRSDAMILYRDGSMMVKGPITANGVELGNYTPTLPLNIYGTTANTVTNNSIGAIGNKCDVGTKSIALSYLGASAYSNSMAMGDDTFASADSFAAGWGASATNTSFAAGNGVIANRHGVIFGNGNTSNRSIADNYSISVGDAVFAYNFSQTFGRGLVMSGSTDASHGFGGMVIGGWNKTSADALFVAGNGSTNSNRSDALVLTRDGKLTTNKVFVSGYNFDTFGQSRLDGNNVCYGTNWMGVSQSHAGFLKYIDGQNPGDTEISDAGSGIQIEFKPNSTQGDLNIINTCTGTPTITKVINVPTASYTNMSTFDSENGPNYMLRKTANGFDIGAAVINTTELPETVQANAYYFIYEM